MPYIAKLFIFIPSKVKWGGGVKGTVWTPGTYLNGPITSKTFEDFTF